MTNRVPMKVSVIGMPVTVTHKKRGKEWICRALEFDLIGIGSTRDKAFAELRDIVNDYLGEVLTTKGPVKLYNPSDGKEYKNKNQKKYHVLAVLVQKGKAVPPRLTNMTELRTRFKNRVQGFDLVPAAA